MEKDKDYQTGFIREGGSLEGSSAFKEFFRTGERLAPFEQNMGWDKILFGQEISSVRGRVSNLEKEVEKIRGSLKMTRPHVKPVANEKGVLFEQLQESIKNLLSNFEDLGLRLNSFIELKSVLANLNKEARKWGDVYLLRSIVVFYASIRHAYAEEIDRKQCDVIKEIGDTIANWGRARERFRSIRAVIKEVGDTITRDRNKYRGIYKKLRSARFRIIPEPSVEEGNEK